MIRPEPGSLAELIEELVVERFAPTGRGADRQVDSPGRIARRQRVLKSMPAEDGEGAQVLPFGRRRKDAVA
jgi:hypothetical protein